MKLLLCVLLALPALSSAASLFKSFEGTYKITARWCAPADSVCLNAKEVTVSYDSAEYFNFVTETMKDKSQVKTLLYEGTYGNGSGGITGNFGKDAYWTTQEERMNAPTLFRSLSMSHVAAGAPVTMQYSEHAVGSPLYKRTYKLEQ